MVILSSSSAPERQGHNGQHPVRTLKMLKKLEHLSYEGRQRQLRLFGLQKRGGNLNVHKIHRDAGSFQWCPVTGPEAMDTNWKLRSFPVSIRKHFFFFFCEDGQALMQVAQRGCDIFILADTSKVSGPGGPGQLAVSVSAWAGELDQMTSRWPFNLNQSVIWAVQ